MKVSAYLFLLACTVAVPAFAADGTAPTVAADGTAPELVLAAEPLPAPAVGSCAAPLDDVLFASNASGIKGGGGNATCTADCGAYPDVSCSISGSCTAVDRNCPNQRGYVQCGSTFKFCPECPCPEGHHRYTQTGGCCDCGIEERAHEQCINGEWVFIDIVCFPNTGPCPWCP